MIVSLVIDGNFELLIRSEMFNGQFTCKCCFEFVLVHDDIVVLFIPVPLIILPSTELSPVTDYIGLNSVSV